MSDNTEKIKTRNNEKAEIKEARVIANYGDPGLDEDYHFDILSRYVIVMIESVDRILTADSWPWTLAVVKRPEHLWINVEGALTTPTEQRRSDALGNVSIGLAGNYSTSSIARINNPYYLGETIKIKKLPKALTPANSDIFLSREAVFSPNITYGTWHSEGSTLPYFAGNSDRILALRQKTIEPYEGSNGYYRCFLQKYQYEAFALSINSSNSSKSEILTKVFSRTWGGVTPVYSSNGGYLFYNYPYITLAAIDYEDINIDNKQRSATNECIPLVITTPNQFPTAKTRAVGTISYNPTYSNIVRG